VAAHRDERHHHVITWLEFGYRVADLDDNAGAFVTADRRKHRRQAVLARDLVGDRHVALENVVIRVAQAGRGHLDQNLAGAWRIELEIFDRPQPAHIVQDRGAAFHAQARRAGSAGVGRKVTGRCLGERNGIPVILVSSSGTNCRSVTRSKRLFSIARVSTLARCMPRQL
jgi:hypothetical protein